MAQTNLREARPELYEKLCEQNNLKRSASLDDEKIAFAPLDEMIAENLWVCPISLEHQDNAYYSISKDADCATWKRASSSMGNILRNLLHEMTHSTGAEGRLDRIKQPHSEVKNMHVRNWWPNWVVLWWHHSMESPKQSKRIVHCISVLGWMY